MSLGAVLACSAAGAAGGYLLFPLAARDSRTVLPPRWRLPLTLIAAVLAGIMAALTGPSWSLPAYVLLAVLGALLAGIDLRTKLLPNTLVSAFFLAAAGLLLLGAAGAGNWAALAGAAAGAAAMFLLYLVLALISPQGMGMGDVKLAGVLGLYGGYAGTTAWLVTAVGGFVLGGLVGVILLVFTSASARTAFPFGPVMLSAAFVAVAGWG